MTYDGNKYKGKDFIRVTKPWIDNMYYRESWFEIEIKKVDDEFFLYLKLSPISDYQYSELKEEHQKLIDNSPYKLYDPQEKNLINSAHFSDYEMISDIPLDYFEKVIIYLKLKNGKYNIESLGEFLGLNQKINPYRNLDYVIIEGYKFIKIGKDGLHGFFFGLEKPNSIKYKKLSNFEGDFARFKLPNGQKGWLDK